MSDEERHVDGMSQASVKALRAERDAYRAAIESHRATKYEIGVTATYDEELYEVLAKHEPR